MKKLSALVTLILFTVFTYAQNKNIIRIATNTYQVSIQISTFRFQKAMQSGGSLSTYAACLQMILDYNGFNVTQDQVLSTAPDASTKPDDFLLNISMARTSLWGRSAHIDCNTINVNEDLIFDELSANRPIILSRNGSSGETASIITAMSYNIRFDAGGNQTGITPVNVTVRDPASGAPSVKIINWADFSSGGNVLYSVNIPPER